MRCIMNIYWPLFNCLRRIVTAWEILSAVKCLEMLEQVFVFLLTTRELERV